MADKERTAAGPVNVLPGFVGTLLRGGAPMIASAPDQLPGSAVGVRSTAASRAGADPPLVRSCRYVLLLPLVWRTGALPVMLLLHLGAYGGVHSGPVLVLCAALVPANALLAVWLLRMPGLTARTARTLAAGDALVAVAANLALSAATPPSGYRVTDVSWHYLAASVALWTLARGVPSGLLPVFGGVPLQAAMLTLAGHPRVYRSVVVSAFGHVLLLLAALLLAAGGLVLLGLGADRVRTRVQRLLHDTVLQTLEAMALASPGDTEHAAERLRELRAMARGQAVELRRELVGPSGGTQSPPFGLVEGLAELVTGTAREGLRVQLVVEDFDDSLSQARRTAVRDAVREALRNTLKHAGTTEAVVRVEERSDGIAVIARDIGVGFDEAGHRPGFGISQSIAARVAEVGGTASVSSRPGHGTCVTLWVPR